MRKLFLLLFIVLQVVVLYGIFQTSRDLSLVQGFNIPYMWGWKWNEGDLNSPYYREDFEQSFASAEKIRLDNFVGNIKIEYADVNEITFKGEKVLLNRVDRSMLVNSYIDEKRYGDEVVITWKKPSSFKGTTGFNGTVIVPRDLQSLALDVSMGRVTSKDGVGDLKINASLGEVNIENHQGSLIVNANLGAVKLYNITPKERLSVSADLGEVIYTGRLATESSIKASLGSVRVTLPADTCVNIDAEVDLGSLDSDFTISSIFGSSRQGLGHKIRGVLGTGTPTGNLEIRADLGSVDIKKVVAW